MLLNDKEIKKQMGERISPFEPKKVSGGPTNPGLLYSYGLGHAGYDARLDKQYWLAGEKTPRSIAPHGRLYVQGRQSLLLSTLETFDMPEDIAARVYGKSTIARRFGLLNVTPIEPGWKGQITLEFTNLGDDMICLMAGQGICQVQFEMLIGSTTPYKGKYQGQKGPTPAKDG